MRYLLMGGLSKYNEISIAKKDMLKLNFVVEGRVYTFNRMPFGLCNAVKTFKQ